MFHHTTIRLAFDAEPMRPIQQTALHIIIDRRAFDGSRNIHLFYHTGSFTVNLKDISIQTAGRQ